MITGTDPVNYYTPIVLVAIIFMAIFSGGIVFACHYIVSKLIKKWR